MSPLDAIGIEDGSVYELLVAHPRSTSGELVERAGLGAGHVGAALSRLCSAGLAHRVPGQPARYTASAPNVVIEPLVDDRERDVRAARSELERLTTLYRDATRVAHPAELIEVVTGTENIHARVRRVQHEAREEILGFDRAPYLKPPGENLPSEEQRLRDGVRYRVIYDRDAVAIPGRLEGDILPAVTRGEQARVREELPMKLFLGDRRVAVIPISSAHGTADAAYVVHPCALLDALLALFEAEWERAVPITRAGPETMPDGDPIPPYAADLLPLLAAGQTDERIARSLGLSQRTTQRRVQRLMTELGASTRFQAGMAAGARGWL
ncbi:helix-turn-helix domain-containing protein [Kribbella sp. NPDC059898]|uniref:helix-turn-helix domain-containing protein n=1 Tax=Kribbella sp. NPDC059898 TaxID=3346995 RepID=UPI003650D5BB